MFRSIKTRLTVTICGILLFVFLIQLAVNYLFAERYYIFQKTLLLKEVYHQMKELSGSSDGIDEVIEGIDTDNNLEIILADDDKNLIYSNRPGNNKPDKLGYHEVSRDGDFIVKEYQESFFNNSEPTILNSDEENGGKLTLLGKLQVGEMKYYLLIQLPVKSISREMRSTNMFILYISLVALLLGGAFVYFIAKQFTKPIEEINQVMINVSNLNFNARTKVSNRRDEISSLEININLMADRLEENIVSLQEANRKLEYDNEYMNKVDEQRKELIANISHELKTPLAILGGYAEMLGNDIPGIDKTFYYETIQDETRKMNLMIQNLLNLSNIENRLSELQLEEIDMVELCDWIYRKSTVLMKKRGIKYEFISQPCGKILADPNYLEEAINNYIANAIQYTEQGKRITVRVEERNHEVVVSVFNEGITINEAHMDKIWNSFYREDKSRTRTSQNNIGLGLYIVRSIMNAHQGKCGVMNKDNGAEFWLSLNEL